MRLWTSRYHNAALARHPATKVGASLGTPKWPVRYAFEKVVELAPAGWMLHLEYESFRRAYRWKLHILGAERVRALLEPHDRGSGVVLLCWEDVSKEGQWCHRTILARWLEEHDFGVVEELPDPAQENEHATAS